MRRRFAPAGGNWIQLGDTYTPGDVVYFGPVHDLMQYRIVGYYKRRGLEYESKESKQGDGQTLVLRYEDWTDYDWNDLVITVERLTGADLPKSVEGLPGWRPIPGVDDGIGAVLPSCDRT